MVNQIQFTISFIMIVLFTMAIIGFSVGIANDNNANINILDDPDLVSLNINASSSAPQFRDDSENTYDSIVDTTIEPGSSVAQSSGPFVITPVNVLTVFKNIITLPFKKIFGGSSSFGIFFTAFISIVLFIFALLAYKTLRGNPG